MILGFMCSYCNIGIVSVNADVVTPKSNAYAIIKHEDVFTGRCACCTRINTYSYEMIEKRVNNIVTNGGTMSKEFNLGVGNLEVGKIYKSTETAGTYRMRMSEAGNLEGKSASDAGWSVEDALSK